MSALWLGAAGTITSETIMLFVIGLPFLMAGTWLGLKLFGKIDEATFPKNRARAPVTVRPGTDCLKPD
jgi:hypothetical protein